jgi:hypothetical protein
MPAKRLLLALALFSITSLVSASSVTFRDANTAVIEVGDPDPANPRQDGYFQIYGSAYLDAYSPSGVDLMFMVYLSDASNTNWLNCSIDTYSDPNAGTVINSLASIISGAKGDSKIVITSDGSGTSCAVSLEVATGNVHVFPYPGFYADASMANFRVDMPVEFSDPDVGYFRYTDGSNSTDLFTPQTSAFHVSVTTADPGYFQCSVSADSSLHDFAVATFGTGGSPVADYSIMADSYNPTSCGSMEFRIGI